VGNFPGFGRGDREAVAPIDVQHHRDIRLSVANVDDLVARHDVPRADFFDRRDLAVAGCDAQERPDLPAVGWNSNRVPTT